MLLKLLLYAGVIKCRCRFICELTFTAHEWFYDPDKCTVASVPDEWLNCEVIEIVPRNVQGKGMLEIYVK